ncbi:MAG TPA: FAD-dependent oxidoreductase [Nonomuraea sp.]|nr:FAD-dependent oxidoreductase [Nonomuraea sp.]
MGDEHRELLEGRVQRLIGMGYPVERVSAGRALALEPDLVPPPAGTEYVFFPGEAYVQATRLLGRLLGEARDRGATVECGVEVTAIDTTASGAKVTLADGRTFVCDVVVTCAGRWTQGVAALAGVDLPMLDPAVSGKVTNGFLVTTAPLPARLSRVLTTAGLNLRPDGGGRVLLQSLHLDDRADPAADVPGEVLDEIMGLLPNVLRATEGATVERAVVGQRAMPGDGLAVAGPLRGRHSRPRPHPGPPSRPAVTLGPCPHDRTPAGCTSARRAPAARAAGAFGERWFVTSGRGPGGGSARHRRR